MPSRSSRQWFMLVMLACWVTTLDAKDPSPVDSLPGNIRQLTSWGERPDFSHDGKRLLFLSKVFGDVYELEIATGRITPCTDHFTHHGFTRALYLSNGDILLSGPTETFDRTDKALRQKARSSCRLSVLEKDLRRPPLPLGVHCDEGPAVSRSRPRIAWTHGLQDKISVADIIVADGVAKLSGERVVLKVADFPATERPARWFETQNFVPPHDRQITVTAYELQGGANSEVFTLDLEDGKLVNRSRSPDHYEEAEGVFPDGEHTLVERAEHRGNHWPLIDIWKLSLKNPQDVVRMTSFTDFKGYKAGEAVMSDDGKTMAFTLGKSGMEAGQGFGLFILQLAK